MKKSLGLILLLSMPAMAQRMNECPVPGQVLSTDYRGESSDIASNSHRRAGSAEIPVSAAFSGSIRTKIYKNFRDRVCRTESYQHQERVCNRISPDLALGRGNEVLASLYDLHNTTLKRAEIFSRNVRFQQTTAPAERLESARLVVTALAKSAAVQGTPKSWDDFSLVLQGAVADGSLQQFLVDEIILTHQAANKRALGYLPLEGAIVNEGRGNGRLNQLFDLDITPEHRAARINKLLTGITIGTARKLSQTIVVFASINGIPSNWNQFVLMLKDSRDQRVISDKEFHQVTVDYEDVNRDAMGFEVNAQVCRLEMQTRYVNVVRLHDRKHVDREVFRNYQISVAGAPLLTGEDEVFSVRFDGFSAPSLYAPSEYNTYRVTQGQEADVTKFDLVGSRKRIKPSNSLVVKLDRSGSISTLQIQNTAFNAKVSAKVVVKVEFYDRRIFKDKRLATETYELTDGALKTITAAIRNKEVDYVKVSMQVVGSSYYNDEFSSEIKIKD
ncbi:MAG: hypothetical protein ACLGHN_01140 [Bacteriovoracia bacterium]